MVQRSGDGPDRDTGLLDLVIQTAPDAIVTTDGGGLILSFSPAAERMFGYAEDEMLGLNVALLTPEPHRRSHEAYISRHLGGGERRMIGVGRTVRGLRRSGATFPAEVAVGELRDARRHIYTGFIRDVTDRVEAARRSNRLQRQLDRLERAQALGELSAALSHEVGMPLMAITAFSRAAARRLKDSPFEIHTARRLLARIAEESRRAGEIMHRMRKLVERGRGDFRREDLADLLRETAALGATVARPDGLAMAFDLPEFLPPIFGDRVQLQQAIVNLMRAAVERSWMVARDAPAPAALPGRAAARVSARLKADGLVEIVVADRSEEPPAAPRPPFFDPFAESADGPRDVGLRVAAAIVRSHGGRIWAAPNAAGGADFHFTLPHVAA